MGLETINFENAKKNQPRPDLVNKYVKDAARLAEKGGDYSKLKIGKKEEYGDMPAADKKNDISFLKNFGPLAGEGIKEALVSAAKNPKEFKEFLKSLEGARLDLKEEQIETLRQLPEVRDAMAVQIRNSLRNNQKTGKGSNTGIELFKEYMADLESEGAASKEEVENLCNSEIVLGEIKKQLIGFVSSPKEYGEYQQQLWEAGIINEKNAKNVEKMMPEIKDKIAEFSAKLNATEAAAYEKEFKKMDMFTPKEKMTIPEPEDSVPTL